MNTMIVIPARLHSTRLPNKPLCVVGGKSLLQHVYDRAVKVGTSRVVVATSDAVIQEHCSDWGMAWRHTLTDHPTGTHRCAEVLERFKDGIDVVVNWQCDEPLVDPQWIEAMIEGLDRPGPHIATLVAPIEGYASHSRHLVKVVASQGYCHWFSRAPMAGSLAHIGVYAFRADTLRKLGRLVPTDLSRAESLEQLIWLEGGFLIRAVAVEKAPLAINTREDLDEFRRLCDAKDDD